VIEQERYEVWGERLFRRIVAERVPASGTIEVTHRCPLGCGHCYNNLPLADAAARAAELTLDEHRRIVDEAAESGCLWLLYTGGEIFARGDFLDIYDHAKRSGMMVTLFTNGVLIDERIADHLAEWRPFAIEITLYGASRETYERLTGRPGAYDRCLRAIRLLHERGLPLSLKTVVVSLNLHELWAMQRFAEDKLGVAFKFDAMVNPRTDCSHSPLALRLTPAEVVALDLVDPRRSAEWQTFCGRHGGSVHTGGNAGLVYHCGAGVNAFAVDPRGRMSLCVLSQRDTFDLRTGSFRDGWERFLRPVRERRASRVTKCTECGLKAMCGMCPANAELEAGDPEEPVDFLCRVAHLRAAALGLEVAPHGVCEYCPGGERRAEIEQMRAELPSLVERIGRGPAPAPGGPRLPVLGGGGGIRA